MNKSFWTFSGVVVLLFIGCFWLGKKSIPAKHAYIAPLVGTTTIPENKKVAAGNEVVPAKNITSTDSKPKSVSRPWEELHGGELYSALFDQKSFSSMSPEDFEKLQDFLFKAYPKDEKSYKAVLLERLGILKALEQQQSLKRAPSSVMLLGLRGLYTQVLNNSNENWLVQRQAFKNLLPALSIQDKENFYRTLNSRVVTLASSSEQEIIEEVLRETR
jgi:hypothetical protein